jgi:hypothetical protein
MPQHALYDMEMYLTNFVQIECKMHYTCSCNSWAVMQKHYEMRLITRLSWDGTKFFMGVFQNFGTNWPPNIVPPKKNRNQN